jgi:hypothetical protein
VQHHHFSVSFFLSLIIIFFFLPFFRLTPNLVYPKAPNIQFTQRTGSIGCAGGGRAIISQAESEVKIRMQLSWSSSARCGSGGGAGWSWRRRSPFVFLTHSCRSFHRYRLQRAATHFPPQQQQPRPQLQPQLRQRNQLLHAPTLILPNFAPSTSLSTIFSKRLFRSTAVMAETQWPAQRVRQTFFEYFEKRGHTLGMRQTPSPSPRPRPRPRPRRCKPPPPKLLHLCPALHLYESHHLLHPFTTSSSCSAR